MPCITDLQLKDQAVTGAISTLFVAPACVRLPGSVVLLAWILLHQIGTLGTLRVPTLTSHITFVLANRCTTLGILIVDLVCAALGVEHPLGFVLPEPGRPVCVPDRNVLVHVGQQLSHRTRALIHKGPVLVSHPVRIHSVRRRKPRARTARCLAGDAPGSEATPRGRKAPRVRYELLTIL